eukprot:1157000-Pelagomonas_calceolata.AAC.8
MLWWHPPINAGVIQRGGYNPSRRGSSSASAGARSQSNVCYRWPLLMLQVQISISWCSAPEQGMMDGLCIHAAGPTWQLYLTTTQQSSVLADDFSSPEEEEQVNVLEFKARQRLAALEAETAQAAMLAKMRDE